MTASIIIARPEKSLPFTGIPVPELRKYTKIQSREPVERDLLNFIESSIDSQNKVVNVSVIKAWWGEGKTDVYESFLLPIFLERDIVNASVLATTIARVFEKREKERVSDVRVGYAFLSSLFEAVEAENSDFTTFDIKRKINENDKNYCHRLIDEISSIEKKFVIFIDEIEQLERRAIKDEIFSGIRSLIDIKKSPLKGEIQLILACTPDAWHRIASSSTEMGGLLQRLRMIELNPLEEIESLTFVYSLLDYLYEKKVPDPHPFINPGISYAIVRSSHFNPRCMIKTLKQIIDTSVVLAKENDHIDKLFQINNEILLKSLLKFKLPLFGTEITCFDDILYNDLINSSKIGDVYKNSKITQILSILCAEPTFHEISSLCKRIDCNERDLQQLLNIINTQLVQKGVFSSEIIWKYKNIKESITNIQDDIKPFIRKYIITDPRDESYIELLPSKREIISQIDTNLTMDFSSYYFKQIYKYLGDDIYIILSNDVLNRIYPSPEFLQLSFIEEKSKRLPYWKEAYEKISNPDINNDLESSVKEMIKDLDFIKGD